MSFTFFIINFTFERLLSDGINSETIFNVSIRSNTIASNDGETK